jgi:hypothetical protein
LFYRAKENPRHAERAGQRLRAPPRRRLLPIVRGNFQNHRLLISRRLLFAKGHAPFACSVVNALATALCRYQPFARKKKTRAGVGAAVEKIEEKRQPEDFSGTARGVAKQLRALLPLPRKRRLRKQLPFSVKSTLRVEEILFGDDPPVGIKSLRRWVDLISSAKRISSTTQISSLREQGFHYKEIAGLFQLNPPIFDGF